jgi:hypothetical protein
MLLKICNEYGNVEMPPPRGYTQVKGKRLQPLCRKLGIAFAPAMIGWGGTKRYPKPLFDGVVVATRSAPKLVSAIAEREARNSPEIRAKRRQQRAEREQRSSPLLAWNGAPERPVGIFGVR